GLSLEQIQQKNFADFFAGDNLAEVSQAVAKLMGEQEVRGLEVRARDSQGGIFEYEVNAVPLQNHGAVTTVLNLARDITARKRAEEALGQLAAIVESSEDAIIGKTLDGLIVSWNAGAQRIYGYTAEEVKGHPVAMLAPPERLDEVLQIRERTKRGERVNHYETVRVRKDGKQIHVSLSISLIKDAAGKIMGDVN